MSEFCIYLSDEKCINCGNGPNGYNSLIKSYSEWQFKQTKIYYVLLNVTSKPNDLTFFLFCLYFYGLEYNCRLLQ